MSPRMVFFRKEMTEFTRTWRMWLLVAPILFFAVTGPIVVWFAPEMMGNTLGASGDGDAATMLPTWLDGYRQWTANLRQITPVVLVVIAGSSVAAECASGTAVPVLVSGLKRRDFVLIKFGVIAIMAVSTITLGTMVTWTISRFFFPGIPIVGSLLIILVGGLLALVLIAMAMLASAFMPDALGAVGLEMILFFLMAATTFWEPARQYSPAGLLTSLSDIVYHDHINILTPAISSVVFIALILWISVTIFERREI